MEKNQFNQQDLPQAFNPDACPRSRNKAGGNTCTIKQICLASSEPPVDCPNAAASSRAEQADTDHTAQLGCAALALGRFSELMHPVVLQPLEAAGQP